MSLRTIQGPVVLALLCAAAVVGIFHLRAMPTGPTPFLLIAFFTLLSIGGRVLHATARDPKQAVRSSMSAMALKMLASLIVLVVVVFATPRERVLEMALTFGGLYVIFLVFDTAHQFKSIQRA
ncbi:MAG TPA: hypothetical protein PLR96_06625 [Flavobacteriales bacterium]|nr:hypothetical protein [Flavobacteriales bacterium]